MDERSLNEGADIAANTRADCLQSLTTVGSQPWVLLQAAMLTARLKTT